MNRRSGGHFSPRLAWEFGVLLIGTPKFQDFTLIVLSAANKGLIQKGYLKKTMLPH